MAFRFTLSQKALGLVALPLVLQVGFFVYLNLMLDKAEKEIQAREHARQVVLRLNAVFGLLMESAADLTVYTWTDDSIYRRRYRHASDAMPDELKALEKLTE